jgi:hypothetical protein
VALIMRQILLAKVGINFAGPGSRSIGVVRLRTKSHFVCLFVCLQRPSRPVTGITICAYNFQILFNHFCQVNPRKGTFPSGTAFPDMFTVSYAIDESLRCNKCNKTNSVAFSPISDRRWSAKLVPIVYG